jgi:hypothetical protein
MADTNVLPAGGPSREEIAKIEIGHTNVSPSVARGLVLFFLVAMTIVPVIETIGARWIVDEQVSTVWSRLAAIPSQVSASVQAVAARGDHSLWSQAVAGNRATIAGLVAFENALEDESVLGHALRPPAQWFLSGVLGAGNERVYVGREGWLFYRPDLEYLTGPGFLDHATIRRRIAAADEWTTPPQPDPRPAILQFHRQLAAQGITLVVVPTPVKPAVHPEKLAAGYRDAREVIENPSYARLAEELRASGVLIFDAATVLREARQSGPQYHATDTHWRPEAMELVAERLAAFVTERVTLPTVRTPEWRTEDQEVVNSGDTLLMLDLPRRQQHYPAERALIRRVLEPDGALWRPDRSADVLVLGDSFSNIYSLASLKWGDAAGLVEQMSYTLARPVDRIVQNDDGAFATRAMLRSAGAERLAGKRVVIWQFAERELAFGDWQVIDVPR